MKITTTGSALSRLCTAAAATILIVQLAMTWIVLCGGGAFSLIWLTVAFAGGAMLAAVGAPLLTGMIGPAKWAVPGLLAAIAASLPWLLDTMLSASVQTFGPSTMAFCLPAVVAMVTSSLLWVWLSVLSISGTDEPGASSGWFTLGGACGLLLPLLHVVAVIPLAWLSIAAVSLAVLTKVLGGKSATKLDSHTGSVARGMAASSAGAMSLSRMTATFASGLAISGGLGLMGLLMPLSAAVVLPAIAISLLTLTLLLTEGVQKHLQRFGVYAAAAGLLLLPFSFSWLIDFNLSVTATVSSTVLLTLARTFQLVLVWQPAVIGWVQSQHRHADQRTAMAQNGAMLTAGVAGGLLLAAAGVSLEQQLATAVLLYVLPVVMGWVPTTAGLADAAAGSAESMAEAVAEVRDRQNSFGKRQLPLAISACAAVMLMMGSRIDESSAIQLLFNARSAAGYRLGLQRDLIEQSHCARLLERHTSDGSPLTVWRTLGDQILIRRGGFPQGQVSSNQLTTPQPIAETLTTLLPLVMHQHAQSVLLLGDDSGVGLSVCCHFPVHTIEAVRQDQTTTDVAKRYAWDVFDPPCDQDNRVVIRHADPIAAARIRRTDDQRFDVVVATPPNPATAGGQAQLTLPFYKAVRSQLTDDGVFCQRITQHDLGAEPLIRIASTLREVFDRVIVLQMSPGEIAFVASVAPDALLDAGLLERMDRDHVIRELGRSGWDWSQVAALPMVDTQDKLGIFEHRETLMAATAANAHFAFALPVESMRWADKGAELQQAFAPHQRRLADATPRTQHYSEYARRFSAVVQQTEILTAFPDNPWPYRKSLKMEMQRNPRPPIETIRDGQVEQQVDPRDNYRKSYFVALGQLLRQAADGVVDPLTLREFDRFVLQYQPLLSYFAAHELIRIHELTGHPSPALELRHRLQTVYYSEPGDFSVRQISAALQQILDDPELLSSTADRYDHVNSMLQELVRRWEARHGYNPPSARQTQQDVDQCVRLAKRALDQMEEWAPELQISEDQLVARRRFLNQSLISPLRLYSQQVLAHRIKTAGPQLDQEVAGPDDLPLLLDPEQALTN